jgi:hypothetical protein
MASAARSRGGSPPSARSSAAGAGTGPHRDSPAARPPPGAAAAALPDQRSRRPRWRAVAAAPLLLLAAALLLAAPRPASAARLQRPPARGRTLRASAAAGFNPFAFNKVCRYAAAGVPRALFENGVPARAAGGTDFLFPLETGEVIGQYPKPWEACFGPKEPYDHEQIHAGKKLPCKYSFSPDNKTVAFEEHHACDVRSSCWGRRTGRGRGAAAPWDGAALGGCSCSPLNPPPCRTHPNTPHPSPNPNPPPSPQVLLKSNCYCYALDRFMGSYCEPGLGGTGEPFKLPGARGWPQAPRGLAVACAPCLHPPLPSAAPPTLPHPPPSPPAVTDCDQVAAGVIADGGVPVDRATVYGRPRPEAGHYIALAIKPSARKGDTGDYHFWRLDSNMQWSYKVRAARGGAGLRSGRWLRLRPPRCCTASCQAARAPPCRASTAAPPRPPAQPPGPPSAPRQAGDTLVRNCLRNGAPIKDIERDEAARGLYKQFCGYFHVTPATHKLVGTDVSGV